ncbi:AAA family ATPase [Nocardia sp. CDC160]|uniref:AAA family ATPase n=1 Tax=Nocardia sp. CDC160 TaxID=3112166 RepID=UPI002DBFB763|nr:ATP-binding protein [Nocardia sp. CDC160]MEC3917130.1 ATP-binding protein [Nocardia sp. CDC160]
MDGVLVLVNGLPGAGKTTLGVGLSRALGAWFLSKDAVKEGLADCIENASEVAELGGIAMDAVWALAGQAAGDVVVDSWWFKPRDLGFARAGIEKAGARRVVEVWCEIPADIARARYVARERPLIYRDQQRLAENWDEWAARAEPLGVGPVLSVDTTREVDHGALAARVRAAAKGP